MKTTKLGEIKIEALKLMFADYTNSYTVDGLAALAADDNYGKYLRAMNGSINRCFDRIRVLKKQPRKSMDLDKGTMEEDDFLMFDLDTATFTNVDAIHRITYLDSDNKVKNSNVEFEIQGRTLVIENKTGDFRLIYREKLPFITTQADTDVIAIEDDLARIIPFYIKSELLEEDEPNLATQARGLFEAYLSQIPKDEDIRQKKVVDVYRGLL